MPHHGAGPFKDQGSSLLRTTDYRRKLRVIAWLEVVRELPALPKLASLATRDFPALARAGLLPRTTLVFWVTQTMINQMEKMAVELMKMSQLQKAHKRDMIGST